MSFKRTKVVMLPTNEKAKHGDLTLTPRDSQKVTVFNGFLSSQLAQHLYFLSDDEIKKGDWCYDEHNKVVFQNNSSGTPGASKKIIATTDKNLIWLDKSEKNPELARPNGLWKCLPQPSEGFIQKFVDSYNSSKPIGEVDVEYELSDYDIFCDRWKLKVNSKDNTITIKKVKDTWTRDEVVNLLQKFNNDKPGVFDCTKWIEENL